jgi:hypothetical protein
MEFLYEDNEIKLQDEDNEMIGEVAFKENEDGNITITHTYVKPNRRGEGLAEKLVEEVVARAEEENKKIFKKRGCSYAVSLFEEKHEKYDHITIIK